MKLQYLYSKLLPHFSNDYEAGSVLVTENSKRKKKDMLEPSIQNVPGVDIHEVYPNFTQKLMKIEREIMISISSITKASKNQYQYLEGNECELVNVQVLVNVLLCLYFTNRLGLW